MNLDNLESPLQNLIKPTALNCSQQFPQHVSSSYPIGTMIPTPGMLHSGNSNLLVTSMVDTSMIAASECNSIAPSDVNIRSLLPTGNGPSSGYCDIAEGSLINRYHQSSSNFSIGSGGNMSTMGAQRTTNQMIPTPGFSDNNSHSYVNLESSNNGGGVFTGESKEISQHWPRIQNVASLKSRMQHNLGSQMRGDIRSSLQHKSFGTMASNIQLVNGTSEDYLTVTPSANSPKPLQQHFDEHQQQLMQGDKYGFCKANPSGYGNFHGSVSSGSMMNTHNLNSVSLQPISKTINQPNLHDMQQAPHIKVYSIDQSNEMNLQSPLSSRENFLQSHQQPHQFQQQQQIGFNHFRMISDLRGQLKPDLGMEHHNEILHSQIPERIKLSELQNQFQHNSVEDLPRSTQSFSLPSGQHARFPSLSQNQLMQQLLHPHQLATESQNGMSCFPVEAQSESVMPDQLNSQAQDATDIPRNISCKQHIQGDFCQRISGQVESQHTNLSSDKSITVKTVSSRRTTDPPNSSIVMCRPGIANRDRTNQQKWLLFLRHARKCAYPEGKCLDGNCVTVQKLWSHMEMCKSSQCSFPRCYRSKVLLHHHKNCKDPGCTVCVPVKSFIKKRREAHKHHASASDLPSSIARACKSFDIGYTGARMISKIPLVVQTSTDLQPPPKRMKLEHPSQSNIPERGSSVASFFVISKPCACEGVHCGNDHCGEMYAPIKSEIAEVKMEDFVSSGEGTPNVSQMKKDGAVDHSNQKHDGESIIFKEATGFAVQENAKAEKEIDQVKVENVTRPAENIAGTKSGKPKIIGVSLTELFTPEQVREHIIGLRQWVGQSKAKAEKNQAMERSMSENCCQLCAVEKLAFEPPPIYCTPCGARIKRNAMYYTMGAGDTRHCFCIPCYNESRGDTITVGRTAIQKGKLEKKKNDEETEESWVQCDKCEAWQHQVCALFNGRRNDGGQAEYTCPNCYISEIERGERKPLPQSAVLGAKDLPRTILSDHIEQRLVWKLKVEREDRARLQGKSYEEVPGAEDLVVRVVSSVDKKLEVKQRFHEIFRDENYPTEFPYKSKVILLFQKIEGVEVCLFGMYVQEFGSECQFPNNRRVYLSYLDSVKYFRPEIKAATGEALRTFVYHEILIGYLEYCKKRGFTSCYIWACPPLKGEDYILYCHPEIQKTPKSDKLREWYLSMLRKATKENIVVELTNLYDHFFVTKGACKTKVTAARLPYFDGDYWPGAAEDLIYQLQQEEDDRKHNKKGTTKKTITKRALKASGQSDLSSKASKDLLLMFRLGETISPMKEDFIMVHLQYACTHCCTLMVSGKRWVCSQCKNFQLCDKCYEAEEKLEGRERHPINQREKHILSPAEIADVPADTKDKDEILESEFFDTRQAFLSLCQGNHYQYDTLRRAKHSSVMVLYHLHNPTAPAFVITCIICHLDIEAGQGWRCEDCPDYDVCNACYLKDGGNVHPHKLTNHTSLADRDAQNKEARQQRVLQLRKMLDLLVHASECRSSVCQYPHCRKVKGLFRHGLQCKIRLAGGCGVCKRMWYLLQIHARACKVSGCHVPRCRDLKQHVKRMQQQAESRRRAAVTEMMRQRAAEVSGNA